MATGTTDTPEIEIPENPADQIAELERMNAPSAEESNRKENFDGLNQKQRQRAQQVSALGEKFADKTGNKELGNLFRDGKNLAGNNPLKSTDAADRFGQNVGKYAQTAANLGGGSEAALAGAVAGAVRGEGVGGVVKSGFSSVMLWFMFGFLTVDIIFSFTIVTGILALFALLYLDIHYVMSLTGSKFFGKMNLFQKGVLLLANLLVAILPLLFVAIIYVIPCGTNTSYYVSKIVHYASLKQIQDLCSVPTTTTPSAAPVTPPSAPLSDEQENRKLLASYGITVNKECVDRTRLVTGTGQTCVGGMQINSLYEVISVMQVCDAWKKTNTPGDTNPPDNRCGVRVTGGTEPGHEAGNCSHAAGYKIDIGLTDELEEYVRRTSAFTAAGMRGSDPLYKRVSGGAIYARESNHWDIAKCS